MAWGHELVWAQETCQEILRGRRSQHAGIHASQEREGWAIKSRTELTLGELPLVRTRSQAPCASIFLKFMRDSPE